MKSWNSIINDIIQSLVKVKLLGKRDVIMEIDDKFNTGYDDICIAQEQWIPFKEKHLGKVSDKDTKSTG